MNIYNFVFIIDSVCLWIDIDPISEVATHGSPHLTLYGVNVSVGIYAVEYNDTTTVIKVYNLCILQELPELKILYIVYIVPVLFE